MDEKKVLVAYTVRRYEDGSIDVVDAGGEATVGTEQIYKDIEDVADIIKMKRIENAAYAGISRFYSAVAAQEAAQQETTIE